MKKLPDYKDEIEKCSKCGKCHEVCPIFQITKNDCAVSRGRFVMLKGVLNGELKINKTIVKYIDMCLKCGKCREFCPSDIDICEILSAAKYEYVKNSFYGKFTRLLQSKKVFNKILHTVEKLTNKTKPLRNTESKTKLLYFSGCANKIFPNTEKSIKKVLSNYDVDLIEKDFDCCGIPFLSSGNIERYNKAKEHNLKLFDGSYEYIITDCASCESTIKTYGTDTKIINICHYLAIQNKKFVFPKHLKITFHKPCHMESDAFLKPLLDKCENIEYIQARDYDECCGFSGEFAIHNPKLSVELSTRKARNLLATGADIIITACPACVIGIREGLTLAGCIRQPKVINIVEFLATSNVVSDLKSN